MSVPTATVTAPASRAIVSTIPLRHVQPGQLFLPASDNAILCTLARGVNGPMPAPAGRIAIVCIAAASERFVGIVSFVDAGEAVRIVELLTPAQYQFAAQGRPH